MEKKKEKKWIIKTYDHLTIPLLDMFPEEIIRHMVKVVFMKMLRIGLYTHTQEEKSGAA